jgi:hypothetical protein
MKGDIIMKKSEKEDLFWFVNDLSKHKIIGQMDLTDGSDYSQGWVDVCNIIMKHINSINED